MSLKNKELKITFKPVGALTGLLVIVLLLEIFLGYKHWYGALTAEPTVVSQGQIVRVNLDSYREIIRMLDEMDYFSPDPRAAEQGSPFQFRE